MSVNWVVAVVAIHWLIKRPEDLRGILILYHYQMFLLWIPYLSDVNFWSEFLYLGRLLLVELNMPLFWRYILCRTLPFFWIQEWFIILVMPFGLTNAPATAQRFVNGTMWALHKVVMWSDKNFHPAGFKTTVSSKVCRVCREKRR